MRKLLLSFFLFALAMNLGACGDDISQNTASEVIQPKRHYTVTAGQCSVGDRRNYIYPSNSAFAKKWEECGRSAWGGADKTTKCILQAYPNLSQGCAGCFGAYVGCSSSNCKWDCTFGSDAKCEKCADDNCRPGLETCTGVPRSQHPKQ